MLSKRQQKKLLKKKRKKVNKKKNNLKSFDKMSFEDREKLRGKLKKERVYTKAFKTPQSFGAASECFVFSPEEVEYMSEIYGYERIIKKENLDER